MKTNGGRFNEWVRKNLELLIPLSIGVTFFIAFYGASILDPSNVNWLIGTGISQDTTQSYLGWQLFKADSWHFPLGWTRLNQYPQGTSVLFVDGIPLMAIFFKAFKFILAQEFQFIGIWTLMCFSLQAIAAYKLISLWIRDRITICLGVVIFLLSPVLLNRATIHSSLSAHWVVLFSLFLFLKSNISVRSTAGWCILGFLSTTIHPYLTIMVGVIFLGNLINRYAQGEKVGILLVSGFAVLSSVLLAGWAISGIFEVGGKINSIDFGNYSMNLHSLIDSRGWSSYFLRKLPVVAEIQGEGTNYLGLSTILLFFASVPVLFLKEPTPPLYGKRLLWGIFILSTLLGMLALSNKVTLFDRTLFVLPLPQKVLLFLSNFRASGRLFWPVHYLIVLFVFVKFSTYALHRLHRGPFYIFLLGLVLLQGFDQNGAMSARSPKNRQGFGTKSYQTPLQNRAWKQLAINHKHIMLMDKGWSHIVAAYPAFWDLAAKAKLTINTGYYARYNEVETAKFMNESYEKMARSEIENDTFYIMLDERDIGGLVKAQFKNPDISVFQLDGYTVVAGNSKIPHIVKEEAKWLDLKFPNFKAVSVVEFTTATTDVFAMGSGWAIERRPHPTWVEGDIAHLNLFFNRGTYGLSARLTPLVSSGVKLQRVFVQINGKTIGHWEVDRPGDYQMMVPTGVLEERTINTVSFICPDALTPKSLGINSDERRLSVAFHRFKLVKRP